jgi:hypothetical protein
VKVTTSLFAKWLIYDPVDYLPNGAVIGSIKFSNLFLAAIHVSKARIYLNQKDAPLGTRP